MSEKIAYQTEPEVAVRLTGARVTGTFRDELFAAANKSGQTPNEFVLRAAAEKLIQSGRDIPGVFRPGDIAELADFMVGPRA